MNSLFSTPSIAAIIEPAASNVAFLLPGEIIVSPSNDEKPFVGKEFLSKLKEGWSDIEKIVATPDMMPELGKLGKILGPKGLMPNPKSGTVTLDVGKAVKSLKAGQIELRVEKNGIVHAQCGKLSFEKKMLVENIMAIYDALLKIGKEHHFDRGSADYDLL